MQLGRGFEACLKTIVGNAAAQVVYVMQSNIPGKPLQDWRELKV
jgi:hypothetical protein